MVQERPLRVLVAKVGLDGHENAAQRDLCCRVSRALGSEDRSEEKQVELQ